MQTVQAFANQCSRNAGVTAVTLAHAGEFDGLTFGKWHACVAPAECAVCNPAALSVSWSHPDVYASAGMLDGEGPLGFEVADISVIDDVSLEWINHNQIVFAQDKLGTHPEKVCESSHNYSHEKVKDNASTTSWVEDALGDKKCIEQESQYRPSQIALRAKNRFHASIIAGHTANGIGK